MLFESLELKEKGMKQGSSLLVIILLIFASGVLGAQNTRILLESFVVETWDGEDSAFFSDSGEPIKWNVLGSRFTAEGRPRVTNVSGEWPIVLFGSKPEAPESLGVLGIRGAYERQGYNKLELVPGTGSGDNFVPKAIPLQGRVQMMDFWVWGGNYNYYVEFHFRDYKGMTHVLLPVQSDRRQEAGSIRFLGWKNMYINFPANISLAENNMAEVPNLSLTKIVFITHPEEAVDDIYIYLDHLRILTDNNKEFYDGFDLSGPQRIDEIWGTGE